MRLLVKRKLRKHRAYGMAEGADAMHRMGARRLMGEPPALGLAIKGYPLRGFHLAQVIHIHRG